MDDEHELQSTDTNEQVRSPSQGRVTPVDEFTSPETEKQNEKRRLRRNRREHTFKRVSVHQSIYLFRSIYVNQDNLERTDDTDEGLNLWTIHLCELFGLFLVFCNL